MALAFWPCFWLHVHKGDLFRHTPRTPCGFVGQNVQSYSMTFSQQCLMSHFPRLTIGPFGPPGRSTPRTAARIFRTPPWSLELVRQDALASNLLQPCWEATVIGVGHCGADMVTWRIMDKEFHNHGNKTERKNGHIWQKGERHVKGHRSNKDNLNMP